MIKNEIIKKTKIRKHFTKYIFSVKPYFTADPEDLNVKEGEDVNLRCQVRQSTS